MRNLNIQFTPNGVLLSNETYSELRQFSISNGETDLPDFPVLIAASDSANTSTTKTGVDLSPKK